MEFKTQNPFPNEKEIQKLIKFIDTVPKGIVAILNPLAPSVTEAGVMLKEEESRDNQFAINNQGYTVAIKTIFDDDLTYNIGDRVLISKHAAPLSERLIATDWYLKNLKPDTIKQIESPDFNKDTKKLYYRRFVCFFFYASDIICKLQKDD